MQSRDIQPQHLSVAKARAILGGEPQFNLEQGLGETIEWYREFMG